MSTSARQAAERYVGRGFAVVPVPHGKKNPGFKGWERLRLSADELPDQFDGKPQNVGLLLGAPSGWLVDVDLDVPEAVKIAGRFLPPTRTSGRESRPDSHWWYFSPGVKTATFKDVDGEMLVELRSAGRQTLVFPSTHPTGERYMWHTANGLEIEEIPAGELTRQVKELATAALITRHVPPVGGRHDYALAVAGFLLRRGRLDEDAVRTIILAAWHAAGADSSEAVRDLEGIVRDTVEKLETGEPVVGGPTLEEITPGIVGRVCKWWGWTREHANGPANNHPNGHPNGHHPLRDTLTDWGNAQRFVSDHGRNVRYCHPWGKWLVWDGKRWVPDDAGEVERMMKATVRGIYAEAAEEENAARRKALAEHAKRSESAKRITDALRLARSEPGIPIKPEQLDTDPWLFNVSNGTMDLRAGELREHRREDLISKLTPVEYDPEAEAPRFVAFLEEILPSAAVREFLQRAIGYALNGTTREHKLPVLHGSGSNGKSTLISILLEMFGDYGLQAADDLLMVKRLAHPPSRPICSGGGSSPTSRPSATVGSQRPSSST